VLRAVGGDVPDRVQDGADEIAEQAEAHEHPEEGLLAAEADGQPDRDNEMQREVEQRQANARES
jgi:hypothetical protein